MGPTPRPERTATPAPGEAREAVAVGAVLVLTLVAGAPALFGSSVWIGLAGSATLGLGVFAFLMARASAREHDRSAFEAQARRLAAFAPLPDIGDPPERLRAFADALAARLDADTQRTREFQSVIDASDSVIVATDPSGLIVLHNRAAADLLAGRPGTPAGRYIDELFTNHELIGIHAAASGGAPQRAHLRMPVGGETRMFQVLAAPADIRPASGASARDARSGVALIVRDVTELAMAAQLKTDFVANASHEFRTPLSSIRAAVETLQDSARDDAAMRDRLLGMIASNVARLEEMTRDLLELSRLETPDTPVDIGPASAAQIAESLEEEFVQVCAEREIGLRFALDPALERLETDPKLLRMILRNLIDNATKFAYPQSEIVVTGAAIAGDEPPGRRRAARFQVTDRGMGIPLAAQRRIFERFYQVDLSRNGTAARRGTGLGLAIVKHAVKALGGTIAVESVWKQGTTMTVDLPACVAAGEQPARG